MKRGRRGLTALLIGLVALWQVAALPVSAFENNSPYSEVYKSSVGTGYIGVGSSRVAFPWTLAARSGGCGSPVYSTEWVFINGSATAWLEQGFGECVDQSKFYYHGVSTNNNWLFLKIQYNYPSAGVSHQWQISRGYSTSVWHWYVDGVEQLPSYTWATNGVYVSAGLEAYYSGVLSAQNWNSLQFTNVYVTNGAWTNWSGQEPANINSPPMCGRYNSDNSWRAGEQTTC